MLNKKSQSISINTIIVAAIALIVLLVIILIFTGKIRVFGEGLDSCAQKGGKCMYPEDEKCRLENGEEVYATISHTDCEKDNKGQVCCVRVIT